MRHYYINKEWIVSDTAKKIYCSASVLSLILLVLPIWIATGSSPDLLRAVYQPLLFLGVLSTAITLVAMEYFLFGFDRSSALKRTLWFFIACVPIVGATTYCLTVYRKCDPAECGKPRVPEEVILS